MYAIGQRVGNFQVTQHLGTKNKNTQYMFRCNGCDKEFPMWSSNIKKTTKCKICGETRKKSYVFISAEGTPSLSEDLDSSVGYSRLPRAYYKVYKCYSDGASEHLKALELSLNRQAGLPIPPELLASLGLTAAITL